VPGDAARPDRPIQQAKEPEAESSGGYDGLVLLLRFVPQAEAKVLAVVDGLV
jgi:hypothetical protein